MSESIAGRLTFKLHIFVLLMVLLLNPFIALGAAADGNVKHHGAHGMSEESSATALTTAVGEKKTHAAEHRMVSSTHSDCCEDNSTCSQNGCHPVLAFLDDTSVSSDSKSALFHYCAFDYLNPALASLTPPPNF